MQIKERDQQGNIKDDFTKVGSKPSIADEIKSLKLAVKALVLKK